MASNQEGRASLVRTDEDRIIEMMIIENGQLGANNKKYEDGDFLPVRQSLYNVETIVPAYDEEIFTQIVWIRPNSMHHTPVYFDSGAQPEVPYCVRQGSLPDDTFIGALMAVSAYTRQDLMQNIFASSPEDFKSYGVFTCRFHVEGEWVEVITDTTLPVLRNDQMGTFVPVYSTSANAGEFWVALAEKAYAKAVGSYEAIQKVRVAEALLHLTGGSVQQINLHDEAQAEGDDALWRRLHHLEDALILCTPVYAAPPPAAAAGAATTTTTTAGNSDEAAAANGSANAGSSNPDDEEGKEPDLSTLMGAAPETAVETVKVHNFQPGKLYSVLLTKEAHGERLVLLHDPWSAPGQSCWFGPWSPASEEWENHPSILEDVTSDPLVPWTRAHPSGYFWMPFALFKANFNSAHLCKLFPNEKFSYYCVPGQWRSHEAGGPPVTVRDRVVVASEAQDSRGIAAVKNTAAVVVDGDSSWFNNPQLRIQATQRCLVYISLVPLSGAEGPEGTPFACLAVTAQPKSSPGAPTPVHLWESATTEVVCTEKIDGAGRVRGAEASIWSLTLDTRHTYHIVPHTLRRAQEGAFIVRLYSSAAINVEKVQPLHTQVMSGDWRMVTKGGAELDSRGGALLTNHVAVDATAGHAPGSAHAAQPNSRWCQNPQYHLEVLDPYSKEELHLKIVLRRTDKGATASTSGHRGSVAGSGADVNVGLVVCKADCLEDLQTKKKAGGPRQNALGEFVAAKPSSLKKKKSATTAPDERLASKGASDKTVLRKLFIAPDAYCQQTSYSSKTEAVVYYPRMPRSWLPNGLLLVPCLSERGVKGSFDLEIHCSEPVSIRALPESFARSLAGEWSEQLAGGSHLSAATWKKNPKYTFKFKNSSVANAPAKVRITLCRHGSEWRALARKDPVGCMIGFYIFVQRETGELIQVFDSPFVPSEENSTGADFQLEQLGPSDEYVIMPATFAEDKCGSFILSVSADYEFSLSGQKK